MRGILTLGLVCLGLTGSAQSLKYKIIWKGDSVGYMHVVRSDSAGYEKFAIESHASFWLFGEKKIVTRIRSMFKEGQLMQSVVTIHRNGSLRESASTRWKGDHYEIIRDGKEQPSLPPIQHSIASSYYRMPEGEVYSERFGKMLLVENNDNEAFVTKPNGYDNIYRYGTFCNYVEVDNTLVKLYIVRLSGYKSQDISDPG